MAVVKLKLLYVSIQLRKLEQQFGAAYDRSIKCYCDARHLLKTSIYISNIAWQVRN